MRNSAFDPAVRVALEAERRGKCSAAVVSCFGKTQYPVFQFKIEVILSEIKNPVNWTGKKSRDHFELAPSDEEAVSEAD